MATPVVPKYHLAPNLSIPPVEAGGILELGSIIADIPSADEPINKHSVDPIPQSSLFCGHQRGFTTTYSRMRSGEYGLWAKSKLFGMEGVGGKLSRASKRSAEDVYHFRSIDTIYFTPSAEYLERSMANPDVRAYISGSGYAPVYIVTGLKTARGPSVKMSDATKLSITAELGLQNRGGVIDVEFGPKLDTSKKLRQEMGFEDSTDFIIGIRLRKVAYAKYWWNRTPGGLRSEEFNKGATMADETVFKMDHEKVVDLGDGSEGAVHVVEEEEEPVDGQVVVTAWVLGS
ncbi:hypothetical protein QBC37DRAFT_300760 [Rhypophila decipiens]|uniref:Uncharacterized protein n=1 Tax=Rhypophila decipiens TaxID=261697 RepID=A0AAN6XTS0_9PEZI|nr:hypothetical protein QBC37DRAFT_300760 [Rhypophila decipiens]